MWSVLFANAIFVRLFASCVCVDSPPLCPLVAYTYCTVHSCYVVVVCTPTMQEPPPEAPSACHVVSPLVVQSLVSQPDLQHTLEGGTCDGVVRHR